MGAGRGLLQNLLRNWVPLIVLSVVGVGVLILGLRLAGEFVEQYRTNVVSKEDGAGRYAAFCQDAVVVQNVNYGEKCRSYLRLSQISPAWEALVGTAAGVGIAPSGLGTLSVVILAVVSAVALTLLYVAYKFWQNYGRNLRGFNDRCDDNFMFNTPQLGASTHHDHYNPVYGKFPAITEHKRD